jgi:hypothetical protein
MTDPSETAKPPDDGLDVVIGEAIKHILFENYHVIDKAIIAMTQYELQKALEEILGNSIRAKIRETISEYSGTITARSIETRLVYMGGDSDLKEYKTYDHPPPIASPVLTEKQIEKLEKS